MSGPGSSAGNSATSLSLLARARSQDEEAWRRLVDLYAPLVVHWCRGKSLAPEDVADVFQEVFQAAAAKLASFRKEAATDTFRGWLRTITRNKIHDHYRRRGKQPVAIGGSEIGRRMSEVVAPEDATEPEPPAEPDADNALFHRALGQIRTHFKDRTWRAFWLTVVDGRSPKDAGEELDMSPGAVRVAKSRVLHRLRDELGDLLE